MSVQILGLREFFDEKTKTTKKHDNLGFKEGWRAPSVEALFRDIDQYVNLIPENQRYNIYYTVADCFDDKKRKLREQHAIPFDIDNIDVNKINETVEACLEVLKVPRSKIGIVFSGNGLQLIVGTTHTITYEGYFEEYRDHYKAICERVNLELKKRNLEGVCDPAVWSPARLMRFPKTLNKKPGKPERQATLINGLIEKLDFSLPNVSMLPEWKKEDFIADITMKRYPPPDTSQVQLECEFLKWNKEKPNEVKEPQWYAMLSVVSRLKDGATLAHEYSQGHGSYSPVETDQKIEQALTRSGPATCKKINSLWGKCNTCVHFTTKLVSPIMIRGPNYIKSQEFGFHERKTDQAGNEKPGKPIYEDLRLFFEQKNPYITLADSEIFYVYNQTHWEEYSRPEMRAFAEAHFMPKATNTMCQEFVGILTRTNIKKKEWFDQSTEGKMNFQNGVLDLKTLELNPHSKEYGFKYVLPYKYEPEAVAPRFEKFFNEVTLERQELKNVILEYAGYAFSSDSCWAHKALLLSGRGRNGKSTLIDTLKMLAGLKNYSSLTMSDLKNDANRFQLDGKLFNLAEETATSALLDSSIFKNLVAGGETMVKKLYHQPFLVRNKTKLMFACNELPDTKDTTSALFERLLIVPFEAKFTDELGNRDPHILEKLKEELPGIFNLIIEGYRRLKRQGKFSEGNILAEQLQAYREEIDPIQNFVKDRLEVLELALVNSQVFTPTYKIFDAYKEECEKRKEVPLTLMKFSKGLKCILPQYDKRYDRQGNMRGIKAVKLIETTEF